MGTRRRVPCCSLPLDLSPEFARCPCRSIRAHPVPAFADKYNAINAAVTRASSAPTAASVPSREAADLARTGRAVKFQEHPQRAGKNIWGKSVNRPPSRIRATAKIDATAEPRRRFSDTAHGEAKR